MAASANNPAAGVDVADAWSRFKDRLHAFVLRRVGKATDADDVVQDVLLRLLQHGERIESDRIAPWLFTTARNALTDRHRKQNRDPTVSDSENADGVASESPSDERQELTACVQPLLAMLSPDDRAVLEQVELAGTSQAQMATEADVPASTIKSRVQRARLRLREHFERCCAIELDARGNPREFTSRGSPDYPRCAACDGETTEKQPGCS